MRNLIHFFAALMLITALPGRAGEITKGDRIFTLKVKPVLVAKCNGCHGDDPEKIKGEYDMLTREKLIVGGGAIGTDVIVPGDAAKSFFVDAIKWADPDFEMPPKENDRLTADQIKDIETWINAGAPWPDDATQLAIRENAARKEVTAEGILVKSSGGLADEWTYRRYKPEDIWAFRPLSKPTVPTVHLSAEALAKEEGTVRDLTLLTPSSALNWPQKMFSQHRKPISGP